MQLTRYTDYSLRVLLYLAVCPDGATIAEVAERYGISRNHLMHIVNDLARRGWIVTERGRGGGMHLAGGTLSMRLGDAVRALEPNFDIVECFSGGHDACVIAPACKLKGVLWNAKEAFLTSLDEHTIGDLVQAPEEIRAALKLNA